MSIIQSISGSVQEGKAKSVKQLVRQALEEGYDPKVILNEGLLTGMMVVADKFKKDEVFVPEVLVSSRAINAGLTILEGYLTTGDGDGYIGRVVLGTVRGDWHDIGKHMVSLSLRAAGFEVVDIGYDADTALFLDTAEKIGADIICMSALLTTTMEEMREVVKLVHERGLQNQIKVMVGGAPISQSFCDEIGADFYGEDAGASAREAVAILKAQKAS